jgi:asparagine synthase (glutamine-hydrolysing)
MLDFAPRLSDDLKIKGFTTKYILKQLSKKYLDDELLKQPKRGFEVPLASWIDNHLKQNIHDTLSSDTYSSNFIDKKFIKNLLDDKIQTTKQKRAKMLWTLYTLEIWHKKEIQI